MLRPSRVPHQLRGREEGDAVPPRGPLRGDAGPVGGGARRGGGGSGAPPGGGRGRWRGEKGTAPVPSRWKGPAARGRSAPTSGRGFPPRDGKEDEGQGGAYPADVRDHPLPLEGEGADPAESRRRSAPGEDDRRGDGGFPARRGARPGGRGAPREAFRGVGALAGQLPPDVPEDQGPTCPGAEDRTVGEGPVRLTEDRISHLSNLVIDRLYKDDIADFPDEAQALREAKKIFGYYGRVEDEVDTFVRQKMAKKKI